MPTLSERILSLWYGPKPLTRLDCLKKLTEIEERLQRTSDEYLTVSMNESNRPQPRAGRRSGAITPGSHDNAESRLSLYTEEYKKEYARCEDVLR